MDKLTVHCVKCNTKMYPREVRPDHTVILSCPCGLLVSVREENGLVQAGQPIIDWQLCDVPRIPTAGLPRWKPRRVPAPEILEGED